MEFSSPTWDPHRSIYRITLRSRFCVDSEPQYVDLSGSQFTVETPDTESEMMKKLVKEFVTHLLAKDQEAKWFASRLKESSILKRLAHKWIPSELKPSSEWVIARWCPVTLEVTSQNFTLVWQVRQFEPSTAQISSRFLSLSRPESPTEAIRQITIQPSNELEAVTDLPFTNETTAIDLEQQMRDKEEVQEARLRLALAKLKANRLVHTYYQKYGEAFTDEEYEDSD